MKAFCIQFAITLTILAVFPLSVGAQPIEVQRISFAAGSSSAKVKGSIVGYKTVEYKLRAKAGQAMMVTLQSSNRSNYFNILAPGQTEVAFFIGSRDGDRFESNLPETGEYTVRVYLMRNAARRNESAKYTLSVAIKKGPVGQTTKSDAKVAGTPYHATGMVPCAMVLGQPNGSCSFGITREGNGTGIVTVTKPDGRTRAIFFKNGKATGYDQSQADTGKFRAEKQGDLNVIRIGEERYEIPDAVIFGG
jgi:hypothetical protein